MLMEMTCYKENSTGELGIREDLRPLPLFGQMQLGIFAYLSFYYDKSTELFIYNHLFP